MKPKSTVTETTRCLGIPLVAFEGKGRSHIIAFFTESHGQLRAGYRVSSSTKKTIASRIPLFSTFDLLLLCPSKASDLYQLKEFDIQRRRPNLNQGTPLAGWAAASVLSELVLKTTEPEEAHPFVFRMLDKALDCIEQGIPPTGILLAFWVKYLEHAGFALRVDRNWDGSEIPDDQVVFLDVLAGEIQPSPGSWRNEEVPWVGGGGRIFKISPHIRGWLKNFRLAVFEQFKDTHISDEDKKQLVEILSTYIELHLDVRLKSLIFWKEIMQREERNRGEPL